MPVEPELGDDPIGIRKAAERIAAERAAEAAAREASVLHKLNEGLKRSSSRLAEGLAGLAKRKIDRVALDELEELLITSDMGTKVASRIAKAFSKDRFDRDNGLVNSIVKATRPLLTDRFFTKPSVTMSRRISGSTTARSAFSTASRSG